MLDLEKNRELYINDKKTIFCWKYKFEKEEKNDIKIIINQLLKDMSYMFNKCSLLTSLDLSNFNTNNVKDMKYIFSNIKKDCEIICKDEKILLEIKNI